MRHGHAYRLAQSTTDMKELGRGGIIEQKECDNDVKQPPAAAGSMRSGTQQWLAAAPAPHQQQEGRSRLDEKLSSSAVRSA
jgi:hypothetical protein